MGGSLLTRGRKNNKRAVMSDINVTPLVDVMLVLLIVFMITSPLLVAGIKIDLPESTTAPMTGQEEPISVTIDRENKIYIQNTQVNLSDLPSKLQAITKQNLEIRIFVRGDKNVNYGKIIEVISIINKVGYGKVALLTEIKNE